MNEELLDVDSRKHIPDEVAVAFYKRCIAYAYKRRCREQDAVDFAGWALCEVIEGRAPNPKWLLADYFRTLMGRTDSPSNEMRQALHTPLSLDAPINGEDGETFFDLLCGRAGTESDWHDLLQSVPMQNALQVRDACLVVAHFAYGVSQKELGATLGITESRICQRIKGALRRMDQVLKGRIVQAHEDGVTAERIARSLNEIELAAKPITVAQVQQVIDDKPKTKRREVIALNIDGIQLEKNIPIPNGYSKEKSPLRLFIEKMEVNDSFVAPLEAGKRAAGAGKALKFKIAVRRVDAERCRIWRTA